jgi:PAS domain S-box-containing protein
MAGSIITIQERKIIQTKLEYNEAMLEEAGKMARLGTWELTLQTKENYWSDVMKEMHGKAFNFLPTFEDHLNNFTPDFRLTLQRIHERILIDKKPFDIDAKRIHSNGKMFWVRIMGWPVIDQQGQIVAVRGIMQDIDNQKQNEEELNKIPILTDQNNRLINFAHIVSHNLRSHSGNISMLLETYKSMTTENERMGVIEMLDKTSQNLTETLSYLNEVVSIQSSTNQQKETCNFQTYLNKTLEVLEGEIRLCNAVITSDFSKISDVDYIPAYMDSLFLNMLTNALKYRHTERNPEIKIQSGIDSNQIWITFQDNGSGIDLERHGTKIFGMYKTFHRNKDSRGIGLFITKNQIETTGGEILVESKVGIGTKFSVFWKC